MSDPRKRKVTITMTTEEWDSLAIFEDSEWTRLASYADAELRSQAARKIGEAVGDPTPRYAIALTEVEAQRPVILDNSATVSIREAINAYVAWWKAGDYKGVSHLGGNNPVAARYGHPVDGLFLSMTPIGVLVFELREVAFMGRYPYFMYTEGEVDLLLALCRDSADVEEHWNGVESSSLSVRFARSRRAPAG